MPCFHGALPVYPKVLLHFSIMLHGAAQGPGTRPESLPTHIVSAFRIEEMAVPHVENKLVFCAMGDWSVGIETPEYLGLSAPGIGIPYYSEMKMYLPPFRRFLRHAIADGVQLVHYTTPGPVGLAALFVASASGPPQLPHDALTQLYDLTPAEIRIFELICEGQTPAAISALLGIAVSTVKSHLFHVFEKTGCRRQIDLIRLAKSLTFPV